MRGRRGFSLIIVLLVSLIGLAVVGAMMQIAMVNAGAGRTASTINRDYNLLVSEAEEARAWIIASLDNGKVPRRADIGAAITSADNLLVWNARRRDLSARDMGLYGLGGNSGTVTVKVYDMRYDADDVSLTEPVEINRLPPALIMSVGDIPKNEVTKDENNLRDDSNSDDKKVPAAELGAYLIRASLEIDDVPAGTVDLAIVARSKDS